MVDFECGICKKSFAFKQWLQRHEKESHPNDPKEEKSWSCEICDKAFKVEEQLKRHVEKVIKERTKSIARYAENYLQTKAISMFI